MITVYRWLRFNIIKVLFQKVSPFQLPGAGHTSHIHCDLNFNQT